MRIMAIGLSTVQVGQRVLAQTIHWTVRDLGDAHGLTTGGAVHFRRLAVR